ncbi:uncharacterized protein LOC119605163 isoform X2 [Lucilia sericata]|uniref:uncharacterized protein LOC119605163 isoform X2 n=1 Tax=Lucilia sericata TaxID=13632 RepID=UPI0018A7F06E|nr:uncharacterized protein LOC119605163 isoform X2 [Lucilia sericata]
MFSKGNVLIIGCILVISNKLTYSHVRFTNVVCECVDPTFCTIERCDLIAISRDSKNMTLKAVLLQLPITDFELRIQVMKRANGWKPFLYDLTVNCNFTKKLNVVTRLIWNGVRNYSNVKHDCPYNVKIWKQSI